MKNIKRRKDTFVKEKITHKTLELKARKDCKDRKVCVCVSVGGGGGSNNQKKTKKIGMMRGGKTKDEKWRGVGINLGGLRNNWEKKKFQGEIYHLFMFVENGFRNSHYYCLMKYITMVMNPGIVESVLFYVNILYARNI